MTQLKIAVQSIIVCFILVSACIAAPAIKFTKEDHDLGRVLYGDVVEAEFPFTNTGDEVLVIKELHASCGCTKAIKGSDEIAPGGTSKIAAAFDSKGQKPGKSIKTITVISNDPNRPKAKLKLYAYVVREVAFIPSGFGVKLKKFTKNISFPLTIKNDGKRPVTITKIETKKPNKATAELKPFPLTIKPNSSEKATLTLTLKKNEEKEYYMGNIWVYMDHPKEKRIRMNYMVKVDAGK